MKWTQSLVVVLLLSAPIIASSAASAPRPAQDDLQEKVDQLLKEVKTLKEKIQQLESESEASRDEVLRLARRNFELRQILKRGGRSGNGSRTDGNGSGTHKKPNGVEKGPDKPIHAKVQFVDRTNGFFLLNKGKPDGIEVGYKFEIVRKVYKTGKKNPEVKHMGIGVVKKLLGERKDHAKMTLTEGKISDLRYDDDAIAYRKTKVKKNGGGSGNLPRKDGVYKIVGRTNDVYMLSYGGLHGAKQSQIVFLYRNQKLVAKLRIDRVQKDYSIARLIDRTKRASFGTGDRISLKEQRALVVGRLIRVDPRAGIWVDAGSEDGARVGMKLIVKRKGKKVGSLILSKVERFWSTAKLDGDTQFDSLAKRDYVEETP